MSFCKEQKKSAAFATDLFGRGRRDSFSSLDARRSGRLYRAKGHGIHCRPILVLLQEANKKIGCFCNRPFWQGQKDSLSSLDARRRQDGSTVPKGTVFTAVLFSSFCKKRIKKSAAFATDLFGRGKRDSFFSSLDARRSGRLYRAKGHGIHCRPILALLQEAKKNRLLLQPTFLAGAEGLEPSTKVLETHVLPLHHTPKHLFSIP